MPRARSSRTAPSRDTEVLLDLGTAHGDSSTKPMEDDIDGARRPAPFPESTRRPTDTSPPPRGPRLAPVEVAVPRSDRGRHQPASDDRLPVPVDAPTARQRGADGPAR